jgi:RNase P protein component
MKREGGKDIGKIFAEGVLVDEAIRRGVREAIRRHRQAGVPMVIWRDGKIMYVAAEQLEKELEALDEATGQGPHASS